MRSALRMRWAKASGQRPPAWRWAATDAGNQYASWNITAPASLAVGDLMLLIAATVDKPNTITPPAGWTTIPGGGPYTDATGFSHIVSQVFSKTATSADLGATYTVTPSTSAVLALGIISIPGGSLDATPAAHGNAITYPGNIMTLTTPAVTPTAKGIVVHFATFVAMGAGVSAFSAATGLTVDGGTGSPTASNAGAAGAHETSSAGVAVAGRAATFTGGTNTSAVGFAVPIAIA